MNFINETISKIKPPDQAAMDSVKAALHQRDLKLGYLEDMLIKYAGITRSARPTIPKKKALVICADHGVAKMGVSAYPPETTVEMTRNYLISRGAVANALANFAGSDLSVVDMGIGADTSAIPGLINRKIAFGTDNIAVGPAMSREAAVRAITTGIQLAEQYIKEGYTCFLPGEMGIANTTSSAAIVAVCGDLSAEEATGRGTNISDQRLQQKIRIVQQVIDTNKPDKNDGIDILHKIGGFEFGCIAGIILGAAANQAVVMLDGFNTGAAALIARALCPKITDYLIGSHLAAERAHHIMLELLGIKPYMDMSFRLGEATGSSIAINLLDCAIGLLAADSDEPATTKLSSEPAKAAPPNVLPLDKAAQDDCSLYIDNLAKPIHSLGRLEELAIQLAGITKNRQPKQLKKALLYFTLNTEPVPPTLHDFAKHAGADLLPIQLPQDNAADATAQLIDKLTQKYTLIAITTADGNPDDYSSPIQTACQHIAAGHAAIITDNDITLSACAAAIAKQPQLSGYLIAGLKQYTALGSQAEQKLQLKPYLDLNTQATIGCGAALTLKLIDASLHMLNDMKTFGTAGVSVATDGPGAGRQNTSV